MLSAETYAELERAVVAAAALEQIDPAEASIARTEIRSVLAEWTAGDSDPRVRGELALIGDVVLERHPTLPAPPPADAAPAQGA